MNNGIASILLVLFNAIAFFIIIFYVMRRFRGNTFNYRAQLRARQYAQMGPLGRLIVRGYGILSVIFILASPFIFQHNEDGRSIGVVVVILVGVVLGFIARRLRI